jgi:hypothetical protein
MRHLFSLLFVTIALLLSSVLNGEISRAQPNESDQSSIENINDGVEELVAETPPTSEAKPASKASSALKVSRISQKSDEQKSSDLYLRQIQRIESQVNELKEEIFRSRTRLAILKESVLASGLSGTELKITHRNEMGANFKLTRILYVLDGSPIEQVTDINGELDRQEEIEILHGNVTPGNHTLEVEMIYRGNGFGVFSYLQSYRFTLNDVLTFRAEEGKRLTISAVGYERSGITLELKDRPNIRFDRKVDDLDQIDNSKSSKADANKRAP